MNRWSPETPSLLVFLCPLTRRTCHFRWVARKGAPLFFFSFSFFFLSLSHHFPWRDAVVMEYRVAKAEFFPFPFPHPLLSADRDVREFGQFWKATFCEYTYVVA
ncbi:hypothetical protein ACMYSQ_007602 [Aspergillus niger]